MFDFANDDEVFSVVSDSEISLAECSENSAELIWIEEQENEEEKPDESINSNEKTVNVTGKKLMNDEKQNRYEYYFVIDRPRKRLRCHQTHKSSIAKENVERGMARKTKKRNIPAKVFSAQIICKCLDNKKSRLSCSSKISVERQQEIFNVYYKDMCWSQKTLFIRSNVKRQPVKNKKSLSHPLIPIKKREFNHIYSLVDGDGVAHEVCRDFFLKCIQVTPNRILNALSSFKSNPDGSENRGKSVSVNKTSESIAKVVREFIESIPKYESHYSRAKSQRMYLSSSLNISTLYKEYKNVREFRSEEAVSEYVFRQIFNTEFNLSFKRPHSDSCKTCDELNVNMKSQLVPEAHKLQLQKSKDDHLNFVEIVHAEFLKDVEIATKSDGEVVVLTFDLQKALETPSLSTSVAFYKRQLWTYNLCIYSEAEKRAYMYVWSENQAGRGGQEIGSCIINHLKNHIPQNTSRIVMYSDRCGGQNRNIKLTMLLKKYLHDLTNDDALESIEQKYFVSGHSYNSCDRSFGLIEKQQKNSPKIYTPSDWVDVITATKKTEPKFHVTVMQTNDFVSSSELLTLIVNRKKDIDGVKFNWLNIRAIKYEKNNPFMLQILCDDDSALKVNIRRKNVSEDSLTMCNLSIIFPDGKAIAKKKFEDLQYLLKFIPIENHEFYVNLKSDEKEKDYGLASDASNV